MPCYQNTGCAEVSIVKNICFIFQNNYPGDVGVRKEIMALLKHGHKVFEIVLRFPKEAKQGTVDGVKIYRIGIQKKRSGKLRYLLEYTTFLCFIVF